jgi:hypothetical protein
MMRPLSDGRKVAEMGCRSAGRHNPVTGVLVKVPEERLQARVTKDFPEGTGEQVNPDEH